MHLAKPLMPECNESASSHEETYSTRKPKMQKCEHKADDLILVPDPAALMQKSKPTNGYMIYKTLLLALWLSH